MNPEASSAAHRVALCCSAHAFSFHWCCFSAHTIWTPDFEDLINAFYLSFCLSTLVPPPHSVFSSFIGVIMSALLVARRSVWLRYCFCFLFFCHHRGHFTLESVLISLHSLCVFNLEPVNKNSKLPGQRQNKKGPAAVSISVSTPIIFSTNRILVAITHFFPKR